MKIVFLDAYTTNPGDISFSVLMNFGDVDIYEYSSVEEGWERGKNAEVIIVNKYVVNEAALENWKACKYICVAATGYNNIDLKSCRSRFVDVSNVRGYSTNSVVQHVFSNILSLSNHSSYYHDEVRKGRWTKSRDFSFFDHSINELNGKVFGVLGQGNIGQKVAVLGQSFGMNVKVVTKYPDRNDDGFEIVNKEELFKESDYISLHLPLNKSTENMINEMSLSLMKPNATLINTSRGPIINENELANHLKNNPDFTAILDVLSSEPPKSDNPLIGLSNCFITPHIAWASKEARVKLVNGIVENIRGYQTSRLINIVN